jgi:hypothetical protein
MEAADGLLHDNVSGAEQVLNGGGGGHASVTLAEDQRFHSLIKLNVFANMAAIYA